MASGLPIVDVFFTLGHNVTNIFFVSYLVCMCLTVMHNLSLS